MYRICGQEEPTWLRSLVSYPTLLAAPYLIFLDFQRPEREVIAGNFLISLWS